MGLEVEGFWNGIITVTAPGMTAEDAAYSEIKPFDGAVFLYGFDGILRTGGREAARGGRQRADAALVESDGQDEELTKDLHDVFVFIR